MTHELDRETRALLNRIGERMTALKHPPLDQLTAEMSRYYFEEARTFFTPIEVDGVEVTEEFVGHVPIRIYRPALGQNLPVHIFMHGGGWVFGSLDSVDSFCKYMSNRVQCIVISVGHRLAPEHKFPAAIEDAVDVVYWAKANAIQLNGEPERVSIGGESSGANIAAAVAIQLRDSHGPSLQHQLLITPVTDYAFDTPSYKEGYTFNLTTEKMKWFWNHYLQHPSQGKQPLASPLRIEDASNLPQTLLVTVEYDPLRSEGQSYGEKLQHFGVDVTQLYYEKLVHSFINMIGEVSIAKDAVDEILATMKRHIHE
ncbi:alpha/beta hydrolase [Pontibacillus yanchengensis]|uniref:Alpha/beta hydrolase n=1 Tax=Pontibacillus yanchengensis Y32 TaxID=1385514 RepID=A0A0A2TDB2_9BACI|nr:alpha/beta hydrolase [Pontibacillus yanchengensis]KGP72096.1 alpha/beta hydrolase [Pontibacillus yanchengensis Y32]